MTTESAGAEEDGDADIRVVAAGLQPRVLSGARRCSTILVDFGCRLQSFSRFLVAADRGAAGVAGALAGATRRRRPGAVCLRRAADSRRRAPLPRCVGPEASRGALCLRADAGGLARARRRGGGRPRADRRLRAASSHIRTPAGSPRRSICCLRTPHSPASAASASGRNASRSSALPPRSPCSPCAGGGRRRNDE
jgi:hypothetical protein